MATMFEPRWHAREREERDRERYPELQFSDPDELMRIDRANLRDGLPLTSFGHLAVETYARVGVPPEERRAIEAQTREEMRVAANTPLLDDPSVLDDPPGEPLALDDPSGAVVPTAQTSPTGFGQTFR